MNKEEWKAEYQAARLLLRSSHKGWYESGCMGLSKARKRCFNLCLQVVDSLHPSINYALWEEGNFVHKPTVETSYCMRGNSRAFSRKKTFKSVRLYGSPKTKFCQYGKDKVRRSAL